LRNRHQPYCADCNLQLCYRALPLLLGLLMTGQPATVSSTAPLHRRHLRGSRRGYDDKSLLIWE